MKQLSITMVALIVGMAVPADTTQVKTRRYTLSLRTSGAKPHASVYVGEQEEPALYMGVIDGELCMRVGGRRLPMSEALHRLRQKGGVCYCGPGCDCGCDGEEDCICSPAIAPAGE